jgi:hypothetical protein
MIDALKAEISSRGVSQPSRFVGQIVTVPRTMVGGAAGALQSDLHFRIEGAEIPGTQIQYQELRHYDMTQKFAYGKMHDELNLVIRVDKDMEVKRFFDAWVDSIYNPRTGNLHYKIDYVGEVHISQLRNDATVAYTAKLIDAFPVQIQPMTLGWDQTTSYNRLTVVFTYRKMEVIVASSVFTNNDPHAAITLSETGGNVRTADPGGFLNQTPIPITPNYSNMPLDPSLRATSNLLNEPSHNLTTTSAVDSIFGFINRG